MSSFSFWLTVGFVGQGFFTARFLVQWLASEKERAVVVPSAFWWLSIVGGAALLSYAVHRRDPVIIVGQSMGLFVYARNLMLEEKRRKRAGRARGAFGPPAPHFHAVDRGEHEVSLATRGPRDDRADGSARM
ncbi:lipid-A-disaccharide synthase N-terminal domain-containing protein [Paludisphaera borealis]|uniref:Lipid-A-disaccharide synthase n=1 Tax=Paludisphaera borealis TaxID=1387353 RepID=A0A1U7CIP4_9BACT|nr:lipid-A-disaccharide synthase N-terminal domain-containing protein [Paludisphaera borealis]APW58778.1 lipid-A-disaccharide synthase [Paludisphaera borealis]